METLLILLGIFGLGAVMVGVHMYAEQGRHLDFGSAPVSQPLKAGLDRRQGDRRLEDPVIFPLVIRGQIVRDDRRLGADRRVNAA